MKNIFSLNISNKALRSGIYKNYHKVVFRRQDIQRKYGPKTWTDPLYKDIQTDNYV